MKTIIQVKGGIRISRIRLLLQPGQRPVKPILRPVRVLLHAVPLLVNAPQTELGGGIPGFRLPDDLTFPLLQKLLHPAASPFQRHQKNDRYQHHQQNRRPFQKIIQPVYMHLIFILDCSGFIHHKL